MLRDLLNKTLTYWEYSGEDRRGKENFADPVLLPCAWSGRRGVSPSANDNTKNATGTCLTLVRLKEKSCVREGEYLDDPPFKDNQILSSERGETISKDEILYRGTF